MKLFEAVGPRGKSWTIPVFMPTPIVSLTSREDAISQYLELATKAEKYLGRPATPHEMRYGLEKPPLSKEQIAESRRQKVRDGRAARLEQEAAYSPENQRLETARQRAEQERVAALSPAQRELESAAKAAQEAEQSKADRAKRAEIKAGSAYQMVRSALDDAILIAKLDPAISQEAVDALTAQSEALNKTADVTTVRSNLATLQKAIAGEIELRDADLKAAVDRAEMRKRMLSSGSVFDAIDVELVGSLPFVVLQSGGKTVKVSQERYDSRKSDEALRSELFGGSEATNV